jgi:micrococcal nuclease
VSLRAIAARTVAMVLVAALGAVIGWQVVATRAGRGTGPGEAVEVVAVVDGDTLLLDTGATVRVLGVDTPETVHPDLTGPQPFGEAASARTRDLVERGAVRIEPDGPDRDHFGRLLRHVWVGNSLLAELLVREGLGTSTPYPGATRYADRLEAAEAVARVARVGIWSVGPTPLPVFASPP